MTGGWWGLASQPFRVTWQGEKRRVSHTPDYFARLEDGSGEVPVLLWRP
ncbi:hypothetical protein [Streptomyces sp. NPDC001100]